MYTYESRDKMATPDVDITSISNIVYRGVGMGIIAGTAMRTLDIVEGKTRKRKKYKPQKIKLIKL